MTMGWKPSTGQKPHHSQVYYFVPNWMQKITHGYTNCLHRHLHLLPWTSPVDYHGTF
jgi:hypothetical protein